MKRRNFVKTLASLAAVGSLPAVAAAAGRSVSEPANEAQGPAAITPRAAARTFALEIDGTDVGFVESAEGGNAVAEVVADGPTGKRLGALSYEPLRVSLTMPPHPEVTKLIQESLNGNARRSLKLIAYDFNMKAQWTREISNAVLTEVSVESLDAGAGKEPVSLLLAFQPEQVRTVDGGGAAGKVSPKQKAATSANFRFSLSGIDAVVAGLALPVAKRSASVRPAGGDLKAAASIGRFDLSNFTMTVTAQQAQPLVEWFEQFAVQRKENTERTAKLELLGPDLKEVLYTISLSGVGIAALRSEKLQSGQDAVAKLQATLYAERITYGS